MAISKQGKPIGLVGYKEKMGKLYGARHLLVPTGIIDSDASFNDFVDSVCGELQKFKIGAEPEEEEKHKRKAKKEDTKDREHTGGQDREA